MMKTLREDARSCKQKMSLRDRTRRSKADKSALFYILKQAKARINRPFFANTVLKKELSLMKNKYGIGFFGIMITAVFLITCAYQLSYYKAKEKADTLRVEKEEIPAEEPEISVPTEGSALKEDCYYLMEVNGYIVVYLSDKKTDRKSVV